jgi:hypothetical protein
LLEYHTQDKKIVVVKKFNEMLSNSVVIIQYIM